MEISFSSKPISSSLNFVGVPVLPEEIDSTASTLGNLMNEKMDSCSILQVSNRKLMDEICQMKGALKGNREGNI